jgi:hypothetical protein
MSACDAVQALLSCTTKNRLIAACYCSQGAEVCESQAVTVQAPPANFKPADALSSINPTSLAGTGSMDAIVSGVSAFGSVVGFINPGSTSPSSEYAQSQPMRRLMQAAEDAVTIAVQVGSVCWLPTV